MTDATTLYLALYNRLRHKRAARNQLVLKYPNGIQPEDIKGLISPEAWQLAERQRVMLEAMDIHFTPGPQLAQWHSPNSSLPLGLFWRGAEQALRTPGVAIVGARNARDSLPWVYDVARYLGLNGVPVISGGAKGVDAEAHWGALAGGGQTMAYLGVAADRYYPAKNRPLFEAILANGGGIASEHPPGVATMPYEHAARNRLIAMHSQSVLVAEAGVKSGTLSTVRWALKLGLPLWCPPKEVPGQRDGLVPYIKAKQIKPLNDPNNLFFS